jgi:MFS family permease
VQLPSIVVFSLLVACSGFAAGLVSLPVIRGMVGLAEGACVPASIVATAKASKPRHIGMNIGIQQMAAPLSRLADFARQVFSASISIKFALVPTSSQCEIASAGYAPLRDFQRRNSRIHLLALDRALPRS